MLHNQEFWLFFTAICGMVDPKGVFLLLYVQIVKINQCNLLIPILNKLCAIGFHFIYIMNYYFCVYIPCDINDHDNLSEYDSTFYKISALCIKNDVQNLCVLGDMNTDLSRFLSWHTKSLLRVIENEDLFIALNHSCAYRWSRIKTG